MSELTTVCFPFPMLDPSGLENWADLTIEQESHGAGRMDLEKEGSGNSFKAGKGERKIELWKLEAFVEGEPEWVTWFDSYSIHGGWSVSYITEALWEPSWESSLGLKIRAAEESENLN